MNKPLKIVFITIAIIILGSIVLFFNPERGTKNEVTNYEQQLQNFKEDTRSQMPPSTPQSQEEIEEIDKAGRIWFKENRTRLYENCAKFEMPPNSDDSGYNSIKKIVTIYSWDEVLQQNMSIELPYEPETGFAGCSDSAKAILKQFKQIQESR